MGIDFPLSAIINILIVEMARNVYNVNVLKGEFQMDEKNKIQLFEDQRVRCAWDEEKEEWLFSVVDVVEVLTGTDNPRRYWSDLKRKLKSEGSELYEKIVQLKLKSADGKLPFCEL
jgi:hypothetical protein